MDFREARQRNRTEMEELWNFQSSTFDTIARRKLIEDQNTSLALSGRVQELRNEVFCVSVSLDFQDAESVRSGNSHVTSRPSVIPTSSDTWRDVATVFRIAERQEKGRQAFGTHMVFRETFFCKSTCIFISSLSSRIESMVDNH